MRKVQKIEVIGDKLYRVFEVGGPVLVGRHPEKRMVTVTSIEDNSMEFPDSLNFIYTVKSEGIIYFSIENCRCIVEYAEGD